MLDLIPGVLGEFAERAQAQRPVIRGWAQYSREDDLSVGLRIMRPRRTHNELWQKPAGPLPKLRHKAAEICAAYQGGMTTPQLAAQYGVGRQVIRSIVKGLPRPPGTPGKHRD